MTTSDDTVLNPDSLHLYAAKSVGQSILFLSIVSLSSAVLGVLILLLMDPTAEARFCNPDPMGQ